MHILSMTFLNERNIFASGYYYDSTGTKGIIYHTRDGGQSWRVVDIDPADKVNFIQMLTPTTGLAGTQYSLYRTHDSWKTWYTVLTGEFGYSLSAFCFQDSLNGLIRKRYKFLKTTDGGNHWIEWATRFPGTSVNKIEYNNRGDILVTLENSGFLIYTDRQILPRTRSNHSPIQSANEFLLYPNYPNPFNATTTIRYRISRRSRVEVTLYTVTGQKIQTLISAWQNPGVHQITFHADNLASGIYLCTMRVNGKSKTQKMILLK